MDGSDQALRRVVLEHEAAGAGAERFVHVLVEVERREDQDAGELVGGKDPAGGLDTVELGHPDVHQDYRRIVAGGHVHRFEAVASLGHHVDVRLVGQQHAEAGADHRLVVGDENADGHRGPPSSGKQVVSRKPPPSAAPADISPP